MKGDRQVKVSQNRGTDLKPSIKNIAVLFVFALIATPSIFYGWRLSLRPSRTSLKQTLASGIVYRRQPYNSPRAYIVHSVAIDLTNPNLKPVVDPPQAEDDQSLAMITSKFVEQYDVTLGINGSFFYPFSEDAPWDYYPKEGDTANALGESISNSQRYGKINKQWNVLCFSAANRAQITSNQKCPANTTQGIAGMQTLAKNSHSTVKSDTKASARTAVGLDRQGKKLWIIVVDGKQPFYSEGVTLKELAQIATDLGCDRVLNLDGGGSTTLAVKQSGKVRLLNAPIHTKIPMRERPVANHLGFGFSSSAKTSI